MPEFTAFTDLAAERLGGAVLLANDEFFAPRENLLKAQPAEWREGEYTERGKWMDGWETRRRRAPGHDWCIVRLGLPGIVRGVVIDTTHFRGNFPSHASVEGAALPPEAEPGVFAGEDLAWTTLVPKSPLEGHAANAFPVTSEARWTHVMLNIYPDGGVARLRVHGTVVPDWDRVLRGGGWVDLAALAHGGRVTAQSDAFFGNAANMLLPGRSTHMGDGWETRRRRGPGHDWAVVRLGRAGAIRRVEIDTDHFKGNAPGSCAVEVCAAPGADVPPADAWRPLLAETPLQPHTRHVFETLADAGAVTHARLNIFPDGGIARLRLIGAAAPA